MKIIDAYVDGSWSVKGKFASWGFIIVENNEVIYQRRGDFAPENPINEGRQVGGEIGAAAEVVKYCIENNCVSRVHYDYVGIRSWIADIWGEKPWRANKFYTKEYRDFMLANRQYIHEMIKVKSHSGHRMNDFVDKVVKAK